jgi:hypothetical protein
MDMIRLRIFVPLAFTSLASALGGCSSARSEARPALQLTLDNVRLYKDGLQQRINAERKAYADLGRIVETAAVESADLTREAHQYLALARMADVILVKDRGVPMGDLVDFLQSFDDRFDASLVAGAEAKVRQEARQRTAMAELARDEAALDTVEEQLMLATRQRTSDQEFKFLLDYAQGTYKKFEALRKLDELRKAATTKPSTQPATSNNN